MENRSLYYDPIRKIYMVEKVNSIGEKEIIKQLKLYSIKYSREVLMKECKYKNHLKFDFRVENGDDFFLLEYDGCQHFKSSIKTGGDEFFNIVKTKDNIKRIWCDKNKRKLFRIRYDQFNNISTLFVEIIKQNNDKLYYKKIRCKHCGLISNDDIYIEPITILCDGCKNCFKIEKKTKT